MLVEGQASGLQRSICSGIRGNHLHKGLAIVDKNMGELPIHRASLAAESKTSIAPMNGRNLDRGRSIALRDLYSAKLPAFGLINATQGESE